MKLFLSIDIEGVAGVVEPLQGQRGNAEYETARRLMTAEANAAIAGAFRGGATEVTVADSHGPMRNMIAEDLDQRVRLVMGSPRPLSMGAGLREDHDGMILIGWHAAAGEVGVLAHTVSGLAFRRIEIDGQAVGEPTLFAGHGADLGVPLLAVSGDDRLAAEIEAQFPQATRIVVKRALGAVAADSMTPKAARALIEEQVARAVAAAAKAKAKATAPHKPPFDLVLHMAKQVFADAGALLPGVTRSGPQTLSHRCDSHAEAIGLISALSIMARGLS
jgi:D-amino peptidase